MGRRFPIRRQSIISFNRTLIVLRIVRCQLKENVALAANRLAFFRRTRGSIQHFIIKNESILRFTQLALYHRLLVAGCPFEFAVELHHAAEQNKRSIERLRGHTRHPCLSREKKSSFRQRSFWILLG